jgi:hypothetical protein
MHFVRIDYWSKELTQMAWRWLFEKSKHVTIYNYHNIVVIDTIYPFIVTVIIHNGMECLKIEYSYTRITVTLLFDKFSDYYLLLFTTVTFILSSNTSVVFDEQKFAFVEQKSGYWWRTCVHSLRLIMTILALSTEKKTSYITNKRQHHCTFHCSPFVECSGCNKPEVKFMYSGNR